jgi:hypothetical protein
MSLEWARTLARQHEARIRALIEAQARLEVSTDVMASPDAVTIWLPRDSTGQALNQVQQAANPFARELPETLSRFRERFDAGRTVRVSLPRTEHRCTGLGSLPDDLASQLRPWKMTGRKTLA